MLGRDCAPSLTSPRPSEGTLSYRAGRLLVLAVIGAGVSLSGCGSQGISAAGPPAPPGPASSTVRVLMHEWGIARSTRKSPAGSVTFTVQNAGLLDHEFLVIATPRLAAELPQIDRLVDEPHAGTTAGQIDDISPGQTRRLTVVLAKGHYALICNNPGPPPHYVSGQHTDFWVV